MLYAYFVDGKYSAVATKTHPVRCGDTANFGQMIGGQTMFKALTNTNLTMATTCAVFAGWGLLSPSTAKAQCHGPAYPVTTYVDYVAPVVPVNTVVVNRPVYVPQPVYVQRPVYVAPNRSRGFNLNVSIGNRVFRGGHGHHRSFRRHNGRAFRRGFAQGRRSNGFRKSSRRFRNNRRFRR